MISGPASRQITKTLVTQASKTGSTSLMLSYYPGREVQRPHAHDHTQVSFLLLGDMRETIGRRDFDLSRPGVCIKPQGMEHADEWGDRGTLIASVRLSGANIENMAMRGAWLPCGQPRIRHVTSIVFSSQAVDPEEAINDLLALIPTAAPSPLRIAPPWLRRVREAILDGDQSSVAAVAAEADIHRVHLSRAFTDYFGLPITLYRRRAMLARAVEVMTHSDISLAAIAAEAGFADQSHMTRVTSEALGLTPKRLRAALSREQPS